LPILEEEAYWADFSKQKVAGAGKHKNQGGAGKHKNQQHGRQARGGGGFKNKKRQHTGADNEASAKKAKHIKFNDGEESSDKPTTDIKSEQ
jgi:hypothetical protein